MNQDFAKTVSFLALHLIVGFSVAYVMTGSVVIAGGVAANHLLRRHAAGVLLENRENLVGRMPPLPSSTALPPAV